MRHVIETLKRGREWRLLLFEFVSYAARNPEFRERFAAGRQNFKAALASALADRIAAHRLQPAVSPGQLAVLVTALVNGLAVDELTEPGGFPDDLLATALLALMDPGGATRASPSDLAARSAAPTRTRPGTTPRGR
jgi:AcrR family transcriptional regulator